MRFCTINYSGDFHGKIGKIKLVNSIYFRIKSKFFTNYKHLSNSYFKNNLNSTQIKENMLRNR